MTSRINPALAIALIAAAAILTATGPAQAQSDWWQRGKDLIGGTGSSGDTTDASLSNTEIASGLKEALQIGTERVVSQLSQTGGFDADPAVHIPLPASLDRVQSALEAVGMSSLLDDLELRLNRAAEQAVPQAKDLFFQAIQQMTLDDARAILSGPDDSATRYFQEKMSPPLAEAMEPIVQSSLTDVGAVQAYDQAMGQYQQIPFVPDAKADLSTYVVQKGMDGIFYYLAQQEAAIRSNPAQRTTELLRKVFGR